MVQDKPNCISFVRLEKWEFQKRRVSTAVVVSQTGDSTYLTVRTHGCETELPNVVFGSLPLVMLNGLERFSITSKILHFVEGFDCQKERVY